MSTVSLLIVVRSLVAGTVITTAVAWWAAVRVDPFDGDTNYGTAARWSVKPPAGWPSGARAKLTNTRADADIVMLQPGFSPFPPDYELIAQFGWPMPSLRMHTFWSGSTLAATPWWERGIRVGERSNGKVVTGDLRLPLAPVWPGFAICAAGWSALALLAQSLWRRRFGKGRCSQCGYQLAQGTPYCPECGRRDAG